MASAAKRSGKRYWLDPCRSCTLLIDWTQTEGTGLCRTCLARERCDLAIAELLEGLRTGPQSTPKTTRATH